jgi:hypothetical protein
MMNEKDDGLTILQMLSPKRSTVTPRPEKRECETSSPIMPSAAKGKRSKERSDWTLKSVLTDSPNATKR